MTGFFAPSHAAWYTLVLVTVGTGGGIYAIHRSQTTEREVSPDRSAISARSVTISRACSLQNLHKGVLRDQELYMLKKAQHKLLKDKQVAQRSSDAG